MLATRRQVSAGFLALALALKKTVAQAAETAVSVTFVTAPGLTNLYRVTPRLYRSAQPEAEGFAYLSKKIGVKTVVSLREFHDDAKLAAGLPLTLRRVPINTWHIGDDGGAKLARALRYIREAEARGPVLLHCQHGSDRTGAVIALYRILYQGRSKQAAIDEMQNGGFGFNPVWAALPEWGNIPAFIKGVDVEAMRRMVGR
jgi:peptidoglycan/xylan/chitin deacetylase (PgdA/CDA1 family)